MADFPTYFEFKKKGSNIINISSKTEMSAFYVIFDGSCNLEDDTNYGISHLLEHLMCKNFVELQPDFEKEAIEWNAFTSFNQIVFYMVGLESSLSKYRDKWFNMLMDWKVTEEEFINERRIVLQEYRDSFMNPFNSQILNLNRKHFGVFNPIGEFSALEKLTWKNILDFQKLQYSKPSKIVNISKSWKCNYDITWNELPIENAYFYTEDSKEPLEKTDEISKKIVILFTDTFTKNIPELKMLTKIFCSGLQSPFYEEIREKKGLTYSIVFDWESFNNDHYLLIGCQTTEDHVEELISTIKEIFENVEKYLTPERFETIHSALKNTYLKKENENYRDVQRWMSKPEHSLQDNLDKIKYESILEIAKDILKIDNFHQWVY